MIELESTTVPTDRLSQHVWTGGAEDGTPLLLVHGNLVSGGWWRYVAAALPDDVRVIAPDLRGFGRTEPRPIDATRGLGDMADDLRSLLETLGLADQQRVNAVGWSMGGGVLWQYALEHPDDFASITQIAPLSPWGYGGTKGAPAQLCFDDGAGSGGGGANAEFVRRIAAGDRSADDPSSSVRVVIEQFFGPRANAEQVDLEFLIDEVLRTRTGEDFYPGDGTASEHWPTLAPGRRGVLNTMAPTWYDASSFADLERKPPVSWIRGGQDQVVADGSLFDLATLGQLGVIPGWPGADVIPPQPMVEQTRAMLDAYRAGGGEAEEVVFADAAHGMPVEIPEQVADVIMERLVR